MPETTVRPARRPAKPGGKRTANRFAQLAGGDATPESDLSPTADDGPDASDGLIAGMSAVALDEAHRVVQIPVAEIAPHPFNDHTRSQPQPGDPKWDELSTEFASPGYDYRSLWFLATRSLRLAPGLSQRSHPRRATS